jgi:hypothetical protein
VIETKYYPNLITLIEMKTNELQESKGLATPEVSTSTVYEYGAMSSKYKLEATNKLTAYATMILHYRNSPHLMVVYEPETCKEDSWFNPTGKISERLDEIFGGEGSFDKYLSENIEAVRSCYKTITQVV